MIEMMPGPGPRWEYPEYRKGEKVGLFIPCYIDQFYPTVGIATARILEEAGVSLEFPPEQTCCGQPAFNSGYWDEAKKVIEQFHRAFGDYEWIVTPSSSCAAMARVFFEEAAPESEAARTGKRVYEFSEFLVRVMGIDHLEARYPHRVTMHIGCHGRRELGVVDPPMQLLRGVRDLEYVELENMEECCGFGGTFSVKMAGTSLAMGRKKAENIQKTGADTVVTIDTSCAMHFGGIMQRDPRMRDIRILHLAELLAQR